MHHHSRALLLVGQAACGYYYSYNQSLDRSVYKLPYSFIGCDMGPPDAVSYHSIHVLETPAQHLLFSSYLAGRSS